MCSLYRFLFLIFNLLENQDLGEKKSTQFSIISCQISGSGGFLSQAHAYDRLILQQARGQRHTPPSPTA